MAGSQSVGLFEAKTRLSELCERVASTGESIVITRRGKPLVRIDPIDRDVPCVWDDRERYIADKGRFREEFELPERSREMPADELEE